MTQHRLHTISYTIVCIRTYAADRVWEDGRLLYSYFPGGYFDGDGTPHYLHNDYQGSVVLVTDSAANIEQRNTYYPYGTPHRTPAGQPIMYGGKERDPITGDYNYDARRLFAPMLLMTTPDPLAAGTPNLSPYVFCAANPIRYIDLTGCRFTDLAKQYVTPYLNEVCRRMYESLESLMGMMQSMAYSNLSEKEHNKAMKSFTKEAQKFCEYKGILKELGELQSSTQEYDIEVSRMYCDPPNPTNEGAVRYDRDGAAYNAKTGIFEIKIHSNNLGSIAHELKHAYQFETGDLNSPARGDGIPFYDITDEKEAYERGKMFGQRLTSTIESMYPNIQLQKAGVSTTLPPQLHDNTTALQFLAKIHKTNFRWKGVTYTAPIEKK